VRNAIEIAVLYCRETLPLRNKFHSSELLLWLIASGLPMPQSNISQKDKTIVGECPRCPNCGRGMRLYCIEPTDTHRHDHRIFSCSECAQQKTVFVQRE
jgi:hypothetical protein